MGGTSVSPTIWLPLLIASRTVWSVPGTSIVVNEYKPFENAASTLLKRIVPNIANFTIQEHFIFCPPAATQRYYTAARSKQAGCRKCAYYAVSKRTLFETSASSAWPVKARTVDLTGSCSTFADRVQETRLHPPTAAPGG